MSGVVNETSDILSNIAGLGMSLRNQLNRKEKINRRGNMNRIT